MDRRFFQPSRPSPHRASTRSADARVSSIHSRPVDRSTQQATRSFKAKPVHGARLSDARLRLHRQNVDRMAAEIAALTGNRLHGLISDEHVRRRIKDSMPYVHDHTCECASIAFEGEILERLYTTKMGHPVELAQQGRSARSLPVLAPDRPHIDSLTNISDRGTISVHLDSIDGVEPPAAVKSVFASAKKAVA